jgi:hypothetical protein
MGSEEVTAQLTLRHLHPKSLPGRQPRTLPPCCLSRHSGLFPLVLATWGLRQWNPAILDDPVPRVSRFAGLLQESGRDFGVVVPSFSVISSLHQRFLDRQALHDLAIVSTICSFRSAGDRRQQLACPAGNVPVGLYS